MQKIVNGARKRAQRLPPEKRKKLLLGKAIAAFAKIGIGATVHADVAREAEVSVPTVFIYFPTREELVSAVIAETERFLLQLMDKAVAKKNTDTAKVLAILNAFASAVDEHPDYVKLWMNWSTIVAEPTWSKYILFQDRILDEFKQLIDEGKAAGEFHANIDSTMGAHLLMGSGHMIAQMKFRHRDNEMIENFIQSLTERALFTTA